MKYTSLDTIVRGMLLQTKRPIHFYIDYLVHSQRCLEELHFDVLGNVRVQLLDLNSYYAATIPCDFMDWTKLYFPDGQFTKPLVQRPGFTRLNNIDATTGDKIPFNNVLIPGYGNALGTGIAFNNTSLFNDHWEAVGRLYGNAGKTPNGFKIIKERNEFQFDQEICANNNQIGLEYISDGSECDNATKVNPYAKKTIETYIIWQYKLNARSYGAGECKEAERMFDQAFDDLKARLNGMTIDDFRAIVMRNTHGSLK